MRSAHADQTICSGTFARGVYVPAGQRIDADRFYHSLDDVAFLPRRWAQLTKSIAHPRTNNLDKVAQLKNHFGGEWRKVYRYLRDGREIHYFEDAQSGAIYDPKWK